MVNTVLVTGATGTIGSEVVKQLAYAGPSVRAAIHSPGNFHKIRGPVVGIIGLDYEKPEMIKMAFKNINKLFLLTPLTQNMVEVTKRLVDAARESDIKKITKISAFGANTRSTTKALKLHYEADRVLEESGIHYTILRPNFFMQNFLNYGEQIRKNNVFYAPVGKIAKVGMIHASDIATVAVKSLLEDHHNGKIYTLTGQKSLTFNDCADILTDICSKKISYIETSDKEARESMNAIGMTDWLIDALLEIYGKINEGGLAEISSTFEDLIGRKPKSFKDFVEENIEVFRQ